MLRLWLARHGEAMDPDSASSDFSRTLTPAGRLKLAESTRFLLERDPPPELILHSPLVRACETAEVMAEEIGGSAVVRVENALSPGIDVDVLLSRLAKTVAERIVCIGHQPDMSRCLSEMIGGGQIRYSPGTIAGLDFPDTICRHRAQLRWLLDPDWFA